MKKIFLSLVFLFGVGTFVMADDTMKVKNDTVAVEDGFKNIDLKEVPQSVKDAIAKKYPESTLKSASLSLKEEGVKAYRIVYVTKEGLHILFCMPLPLLLLEKEKHFYESIRDIF